MRRGEAPPQFIKAPAGLKNPFPCLPPNQTRIWGKGPDVILARVQITELWYKLITVERFAFDSARRLISLLI